VDDGLDVGDLRADALCDVDSLAAACGAEVPQAHTVTAITTSAAAARSDPGSMVRSGNQQPLVLRDIPAPPLAANR
jgi:hypothetical protein